MGGGTIFLVAICIMIITVVLYMKAREKKQSRQTRINVTQPQYKKTAGNLAVIIKCVERDLAIIDESKSIINKSKNIDTILSRFTTLFTSINRIIEYDSKYPGLDLRPPIREVEQFYKREKERFLTSHVTERTNEIIGEITSENNNAKKEKLAKEALSLIDKVTKELTNSENVNKLDEIIIKIRELVDVSISQNDNEISSSEFQPKKSHTLREGKLVETDIAFNAWTSGDLQKMLNALEKKTNPIDRHFLLMGIVDETYKMRNDPEMRKKCKEVAEIHISEFPDIAPPLKKDMGGKLPRVTTFQKYATVLAEDGEYNKAIDVCKIAILYKLSDGTESGYEGRIERIMKKMKENEMSIDK